MKTLIETIANQEMNPETRTLVWKGVPVPEYEITSNGDLYRNGKQLKSWKVNGRNYYNVTIDNHVWQYRADYMVAYTFKGKPEDAIRLIHIDEDIANDKLSNLMWYRKVDVVKEYINLAIVEPDGSIEEEWRPCLIEHNPNIHYEVSNFGMIRDANTKEFVELYENHGYKVFYYLDDKSKTTRVKAIHRAVAQAFIPNPNNYEIVNHLDGNTFNDVIYNLEWSSSSMNAEHAYLQNLNHRTVYTLQQVHAVCDLLTRMKISHVQISYMTGVDRKTISDIFRGRRWADISQNYSFVVKKWNQSMKEEVCRLILTGMKGKEIFDKLDMKYDQSAMSFYERMRRDLKRAGKIC